MKLLLDTHTFIWFITDSPKLTPMSKQLIEDENNQRLISMASIWEMAIKHSIGKLRFQPSFDEFIEEQIFVNKLTIIHVNLNHIKTVASLPLYHRDPFDRLIIAQSIVEKVPIISADKIFDSYSIIRLWS